MSKESYNRERRVLLGGLGALLLQLGLRGSEPNVEENEAEKFDPVRFLILADIHSDGGAEILERVKKLLDRFSSEVDAIMVLGDTVTQVEDVVVNEKNYKQVVGLVTSYGKEVYMINGNHDLYTGMSVKEIEEINKDMGVENNSFSYKEFPGFQLLTLGLVRPTYGPGKLPLDQLLSMRGYIRRDKSLIVATHCGVLRQDSVDNAYFNGVPEYTAYENGIFIEQFLEGLPIMLMVNGHMHNKGHELVGGRNVVRLPATNNPDYTGGACAIMTVTGNNCIVRCYANNYEGCTDSFGPYRYEGWDRKR